MRKTSPGALESVRAPWDRPPSPGAAHRPACRERPAEDDQTLEQTPQHDYDETKVKTLSSLEHIRKRTGMYIGRIGTGQQYDDGIYILLKEVIDNS